MKYIHLFLLAVSVYGADTELLDPAPIALYEPVLEQPLFQTDSFQFPDPVMKLPLKKNAFGAATLSFFCPGLGHTYLGDFKTAGGIFGTTFVTVGAGTYPDASQEMVVNNLVVAQNTWAYGIYAAYRDARTLNGQLNYHYRMPTDSLADLTSAPFRPSVLKKPEVWGGFLGAFALAGTVSYFMLPQDGSMHMSLSTSKMALSPFAAFPVGIGEEALFRGYLQSQLCEYMPPMASIALSSLAFGAVHIPNALAFPEEERWRYYTVSLPVITTLGAYFGWLTNKNHSLKESVAIHAWYDFVLFAASSAVHSASSPGRSEFCFATDF